MIIDIAYLVEIESVGCQATPEFIPLDWFELIIIKLPHLFQPTSLTYREMLIEILINSILNDFHYFSECDWKKSIDKFEKVEELTL